MVVQELHNSNISSHRSRASNILNAGMMDS